MRLTSEVPLWRQVLPLFEGLTSVELEMESRSGAGVPYAGRRVPDRMDEASAAAVRGADISGEMIKSRGRSNRLVLRPVSMQVLPLFEGLTSDEVSQIIELSTPVRLIPPTLLLLLPSQELIGIKVYEP